jgi:hypothetical protein
MHMWIDETREQEQAARVDLLVDGPCICLANVGDDAIVADHVRRISPAARHERPAPQPQPHRCGW